MRIVVLYNNIEVGQLNSFVIIKEMMHQYPQDIIRPSIHLKYLSNPKQKPSFNPYIVHIYILIDDDGYNDHIFS